MHERVHFLFLESH